MFKVDVRVGDSPCKDCPDRYPACHDHCEKYQTWKGRLTEVHQLDWEEKKRIKTIESYEVERSCKRNRKPRAIK